GLRSAFLKAQVNHVTLAAATGDFGATNPMADGVTLFPFRTVIWPGSDPLVTAIGGTQVSLDPAGDRLTPDVGWSGSGGGLSTFFPNPAFQAPVAGTVGTQRGMPDVSMSAAPIGAAVIYFTFVNPTSPWHTVAGTSEATPEFAGIVALADQAAGHPLGNIE